MREPTIFRRCFELEAFYESLDRHFSKGHDFDGEVHDFWEAVFINEGEVEVTEEENVYRLSQGDIVFHAPMEFHRIKSAGNTTPHVFNLSFWTKGDYPKTILDGVIRLDGMERKEFMSICELAAEFIFGEKKDGYLMQECADRLLAFMLKLNRNHQFQQLGSSSEKALAYKRLVEIMNQEIYNNVSVAEIAEKAFMSVSYVKVLFNRYAGVSPKSYYANLRILEATRLLSAGVAIKEVAETMNFSSPNYFSVFFKKHMNMTPKQFKTWEKQKGWQRKLVNIGDEEQLSWLTQGISVAKDNQE